MKRKFKFIYVLSCIALVCSCAEGTNSIFDPTKHDLLDQELGLSREDYKHVTDAPNAKKDGVDAKTSTNIIEPPIPDLAEILAAPRPPKLGETQLVSVAVTDDVPLKDVLIELARLANVDIEVDSSITGGIDFRAKDRPFNEVIERIADLAGLRYTMKDKVLRVERDTPYVQVYSLDFLNMERSSTSSVNISTSVLASSGGGGGGGGGGLTNGSSSTITSKADSDFWKQLEASIKQILAYNESSRISSTTISTQPNAPAAPGQPPSGGAPAAANNAAANNNAAGGGANADGSFYILNKEASTLTVSATQKQHELMKQFLKKIEANTSSQVLIEAKIVEVTLSDEFQSGIDWSKLGSKKVNLSGTKFNPSATTDANNISTLTLNLGNDLEGAVQLSQIFGTTRTLASPRLHATNNKEAVLTFAENDIYFSITATQSQSAAPSGTATGINTTTVTSTSHSVPIGIILSLQPSIDTETNEVTMSVHPTLSRIIGSVNDPAVSYVLAQAAAAGAPITGVTAAVPIVEVRELDSILKLKSGQVMVIGGLMQDVNTDNESGIPGVSAVPWIGNLFKGNDKTSKVSELVIFIRATIVDSHGDSAPADKNFYQKFTKDPRPLPF